MKKTILITGGFGFIGHNLLPYFSRKTSIQKIKLFDKNPSAGWKTYVPKQFQHKIEVIRGDILNDEEISHALSGIDIVLHLAALTHAGRSINEPIPYIETNIIGTVNLLEAAAKHNIKKFVYFSSSEVYGDKTTMTMNESHPLNPVTPYAVSKLAAEKMSLSYYYTKHVPVIAVRPFNLYGPYQYVDKMIPLFITRLLQGEQIMLNHGGKQKRDWIYIDDLLDAIYTIIESTDKSIIGEVFNIGTGKTTPVNTIVRKLLQLTKRNNSYITYSQQSKPETMSNVGISEKIENILRWKAETVIDEGLQKTVTWYKNNESWWKK